MKNKIYYILSILYILMFGLILYLNGVFTGEVSSLSNFLINIAFLIVIGILFLCCFRSFGRLNQATDALMREADEMERQYAVSKQSLWPEYRKKQSLFGIPALDDKFSRYQRRIEQHTNPRGIVTESCRLDEYINEDLLDEIGSAHFNSAISGTLTGLGILGTFLGLALGMVSFSGDDIFVISDNIGPLLEGMKLAFHTSVYGIFFSLVFTFVYRSLMADAYEKLSRFMDVFNECAAPSINTTDENTSAMLIYQANMAGTLKTIMELMQGTSAEQTRGMEKIVQMFMNQLSDSMGANLEQLGRSLNQSCEAQETYVRSFQRLEESTKLLLEASRTMYDTLNLSLERQKDLEQKLSQTCDSLNTELYTFHKMRDLYEK